MRRWFARLLLLMSFFSGTVLAVPAPCEGGQESARAMLHRIRQEWPLRGSGDVVTRYVQSLGVRLAHFSIYGRNAFWHFSVIRNLAPNAFSIGNGYVFITDGAINFVQSESELAAILAHELGHELAGHFCGVPYPDDFSSLFELFSSPKAAKRQVDIGSLTLSIDPVKEQQADKIAISILQASGYDPHAILNVARRLPKGETIHPVDTQRLQSLESLLAKIPPTKAQDSEDFRKIKRSLELERAGW
jgi:predicted Zn-dependent protease